MFLDLTRLHGPDERIERTYAPADFEERDDEFVVAAAVRLAFDIRKMGDEYHLAGEIHSRLGLTCSRCLERFEVPLDAAFALHYVPAVRNAGEGEVEVAEEDLATAFYRDERIDLGQLMREQFYLGLPMKPLCHEACRGLCPQCGTNLNTSTCDCLVAWEDPRLAALRALLKTRQQD